MGTGFRGLKNVFKILSISVLIIVQSCSPPLEVNYDDFGIEVSQNQATYFGKEYTGKVEGYAIESLTFTPDVSGDDFAVTISQWATN